MSKKLTLNFDRSVATIKNGLNKYQYELAHQVFYRPYIIQRPNEIRIGSRGSLCIFDDGRWYSHEHNIGDYDLISFLEWILDCDFKEALEWANDFLDELSEFDEYDSAVSQKVPPSNKERIDYAKSYWKQRNGINGTIGNKYLKKRGVIGLPKYTRGKLGFLPSHKHSPSNRYLPCLIAKVQDVNLKFAGIHRTYLNKKGDKSKVTPNKMRLGAAQGAAIKLTPIKPHIHICEGLEDALSLLMMFPDIGVWCGMGGNIENVLFPSKVKKVTIACDNDDAGERYAKKLARRLLNEKRSIEFINPDKEFKDFNQQLKEYKNG